MKIKDHDLSKFLKKLSSRHHYIPKFLSNGFTNTDGLLYLYDKRKDLILKKPRSPKSVFFEDGRNTVELNSSIKTSIIEDFLYKQIDDKTCKVIKEYQSRDLSEIDFNTEDSATILFFLISLFWRIPKTDYAANDLMDRSKITSEGIDSEILRNDPTYRKMNRAGILIHHISEMIKLDAKGTKWLNIHQNENHIHVIGDYPIIFRDQPSLFSDFNDIDILIAVSANRIYSSTKEKFENFQTKNSMRYNACVINQSVHYIACGSLKILEESVFFYKKLKEKGLIYNFEKVVFDTK